MPNDDHVRARATEFYLAICFVDATKVKVGDRLAGGLEVTATRTSASRKTVFFTIAGWDHEMNESAGNKVGVESGYWQAARQAGIFEQRDQGSSAD